MSGFRAVAWKEARELIPGRGSARLALCGVAAIGAIPVLVGTGVRDPTLLHVHLVMLPTSLAILWATDTFAGERERRTLDTLLASGIPDGSLLAGKVTVSVFGAWAGGLLAHGVGRIVGFALGEAGPAPPVLGRALLLGFLCVVGGGLAGTLGSLRAHSTREAMARLLPLWIVLDIALRWVAATTDWRLGSAAILAAVAGFDVLLALAATRAFRRRRLILGTSLRRAPALSPPRRRCAVAVADGPSLRRDVATVLWKEATAIKRSLPLAPRATAVLAALYLGAFIPLAIGGRPDAWELPVALPFAAFLLPPMLAVDAIAGERVQGTWETLRSTRLSLRILFLGKAAALWLTSVGTCLAASALVFAGLAARRGWPEESEFSWGVWSSLVVFGAVVAAWQVFLCLGSMCRTDSSKVAQAISVPLSVAPLVLLARLDARLGGTLVVDPTWAPWAATLVVVATAGTASWAWQRFRAP